MNLSKAAKVTRVANGAAAGQTAVTSSSVDTTGSAAVEFLVLMGAITTGAATSVKLQGSSDDSNWSDLEGTGQTIADDDDNKVFILDLANSRYRYVRCVVSRATQDSVVDGIVARQYAADKEPVTHDSSTVGGSEFHHAPAAGTA
ncbi:MAG: hypothetical protein CMJ58_16975 [Planctomycetaceae bacterium]|nr:hypothetical protein [Planctomycetaceae bacterium]